MSGFACTAHTVPHSVCVGLPVLPILYRIVYVWVCLYGACCAHQVVVCFDSKQLSEVAEGQGGVGLQSEVREVVGGGEVAALTESPRRNTAHRDISAAGATTMTHIHKPTNAL